jgi:multidrug efflux pump subunit AcrB
MIQAALKNPYMVLVVALMILVVGVVSYQQIPADLLPIFKTPAVQIVTFYPGMPPEVMERDIMSRMERWTGQSVGIEHQEAKAMLGVCVVKDFFREDISMDTAMSQVTSYAVSDMFYLPPGTIPPMVMPFDPTASVPLCLVSVSSTETNAAFWIDPRNGNHYFMGVQYDEKDINSLDTLLNIPVTGDGSKQPVPLRNLAHIEQKTGPAMISHRNITRATDIYANVEPGHDVGSVVAAIERRLEADPELQLVSETTERGQVYEVSGPKYAGKGYTIEMQGEVRSMRAAFWQFSSGMAIAAILIFLAMVALLRSFATPWVVMATIPLGLVGVAVIMWCTGTHLNIQSLMGIIMMMGIVVEYSIVLLDFADERVREGKSPEEAVYEAAIVRFRPILMTSVTTILALLPMAVGFAGSDADQPLALTIVGGVIAATLLPKFVVPCMYSLIKQPPAAVAAETIQ